MESLCLMRVLFLSACPEDTYSLGGSGTSCALCPLHSGTKGNTAAVSVQSCECDDGYQRSADDDSCEGKYAV